MKLVKSSDPIIDCLESLLREAKNGNISSLAYVKLSKRGVIGEGVQTSPNATTHELMLIYAYLDVLKNKILTYADFEPTRLTVYEAPNPAADNDDKRTKDKPKKNLTIEDSEDW